MSIERSAELLRQALPWMSRQAAALHPVSYAVWFDYVAQTNAPLRAAVDEQLAREGTLDEFATWAIFKRHVADVDPETAQRIVDGVQRMLGGVGEAVSATGTHAARFGSSLAQLAGALERGDTGGGMGGVVGGVESPGIARNGPAPRLLADVVAEVIADTGTMRSQLGGLQQRLADSRREIERLRDEVRRARSDALRDSLTGLANRRAFDQALAACLAAPPAGASPRGPWLLMSDIDHFERIDEAYGKAFGEQVLKAVAEALRGLVPGGGTLARVGGEAFAILLPPELDADAARALADAVHQRIGSARIRKPGQDEVQRVTLSVGLAPRHAGDTAQAFVERADGALRRAKGDGRDRVVSVE